MKVNISVAYGRRNIAGCDYPRVASMGQPRLVARIPDDLAAKGQKAAERLWQGDVQKGVELIIGDALRKQVRQMNGNSTGRSQRRALRIR